MKEFLITRRINKPMWGPITAIATAAAAAVAIISLLAILRDSRERTRPLVTADLERAPLSRDQRHLDLVLRNSGATAARDLRVAFDPTPIIIPRDERRPQVATVLEKRFTGTLRILPPGRPIRSAYYIGEQNPNKPSDVRNSEPLPDTFTVIASYKDYRGRPYSDTFELSVDDYLHETEVTGKSVPANPQKDLVHAAENIVRQLNRH
ncbi:hypothetical protein FOE78_07840 [Microlunatus elymi]|uniref:Uncharacterized protein n=1 Tax=Microlunatus elymi TaxID=2596828 RepID=A0A516PXC3_9ACTN|nr:hypothetical protein [Microlunatus elymi]QDP95823.1 hypothetical protein FOE78_07840 [Microlunatus elymi]